MAISCALAQNTNLVVHVKGVNIKMIKVDGGTFMMGCDAEWPNDCQDWEKPAHKVTLDGFYIGETEVTQELWKVVMGNNPSEYEGTQNPVENVSREDVERFIDALNELTGEMFRLPTEAEWEFASRGGVYSKGYKYSGSNDINEVGWHDGNSNERPHPVKMKKPNELGLYDMSGNVLEWCSDWWELYNENDVVNPEGPKSGFYGAFRSGCWAGDAKYCRNSYRNSDATYLKNGFFGFRLAMSLPVSEVGQDDDSATKSKMMRPKFTGEETRAMVGLSLIMVANKLDKENVQIGLYGASLREVSNDEFSSVAKSINDDYSKYIDIFRKLFDPIKKSYVVGYLAYVLKACECETDQEVVKNFWNIVSNVLNMKVNDDLDTLVNYYLGFEHKN